MKIIDGKAIAQELRAELKEKIAQQERKPGLAVVIVGEDPASRIYVRNKIKACGEIGIRSYAFELPENSTQNDVEELLDKLANDKEIDGILLQLPLPKHLDSESAIAHIPVSKDVDGFSAEHLGLLLQHKEEIVACTPLGIMKMLEKEGIDLKGKNAVVLGRSETVGKPMAMLLLNADATVTICHSKTKDIQSICKNADILVAAVNEAIKRVEDTNAEEMGKITGSMGMGLPGMF